MTTGKLMELSLQFFEKDYATPAGAFDLSSLDQAVQ